MLTTRDVTRALEDERHLGWGLATMSHLPQHTQTAVKRAVVRQANVLGIGYEDLFHWSNSKTARWMVDEVADGAGPSPMARKYVTAARVAEARP